MEHRIQYFKKNFLTILLIITTFVNIIAFYEMQTSKEILGDDSESEEDTPPDFELFPSPPLPATEKTNEKIDPSITRLEEENQKREKHQIDNIPFLPDGAKEMMISATKGKRGRRIIQ